jgi:hypothetical protein
VAGLTAVDGATIINDRYELMAFGAKIMRRRGSPAVERIVVTEPVEGSQVSYTTPAQLGGTRHCRPPSSSTTSATRLPWSPRRTDGLPFSSGQRRKSWCMDTEWKYF